MPAAESLFPSVPVAESISKPEPQKGDQRSRALSPAFFFSAVGVILLLLLSIAPIWNAIYLLQDSNYVFWAGRTVPRGIILVCGGIVLFYGVSVHWLFKKVHNPLSTEKTVMIILQITVTIFGLFLMMAASSLTHQAESTFTNLMYRCDNSGQTNMHRLYEYSQVLQNIRATPECAKLYTVEECDGYKEVAPYTTFLKGMEESFRCSGFCISNPIVTASPKHPVVSSFKLISTKQHLRQSILATDTAHKQEHILENTGSLLDSSYPPTLFSDMNFQASCEGFAARDMKNVAGLMGQQMFLHGIYLVFTAVFVSLTGLIGFCIPK